MLWLLALVPLLAAAAIHATGLRGRIPLAAAAGLALAAVLVLALLAAAGEWRAAFAWGPGLLELRAALTPLSAVAAVTVPAVALPVLLYAAAHEHRPGLGRLIALLLAFVGTMELLVIAADLVTLLIGWELVGACSWALIGHHWRDAANPAAGRYAFVMTRLGDLGLFLAAMAAFAGTGSFAYAALTQLEGPMLQLLVAGVLVSAAAKSGQVPFAPWLFRAMNGPTSVSALLHAATMVAAGAYLLARLHPILDRVDWFSSAAITVGLTTALGGGLVALLQPDAKKLLAASTSAHFGLMFVAVGAGYPAVAILHLVAHAGFKALLFLAAGIAGQRAGSFELIRMGYGRALPWTAGFTAIGALALAGMPPLGAAWSKEAIVTAAGHVDYALAVAVIGAGGLSAACAGRFQLLAYGLPRVQRPEPARPHALETAALGLLALASVVLSVLWLPSVRGASAALLDAELPQSKPWELAASLLALGLGLYAGRLLARRHAALGAAGPGLTLADWVGLPAAVRAVATRPVSALALTAARFDDSGVDALPRAVAALGRTLADAWSGVGEWIVDGLPEGTGRLAGMVGEDARRLHTGLSHHYYAMVAVGTVVLAGILFLGSR